MSIRYDPEWFSGFEPTLRAINSVPKPRLHNVQARRDSVAAMQVVMDTLPDSPDVVQTVHHAIAPSGHKVPIHAFQKKTGHEPPPKSAVLYLHGGGMISGSVQLYERLISTQVQQSGVSFFGVEYRLAPEATNTGPIEDCYAALVWISQNAEQFGVERARIGVMGDSAGGGLAVGLALMARDRSFAPPLAKQILIYPMIDDTNIKLVEALEPFAAIWNCEDNATGWSALLGKDRAGRPNADISIYCAPTRAKSLAGLPPTYIDVGNLDYFRDEDMVFAGRLAAENIDVEFHLYPGVPHGFDLFSPQSGIVRLAKANRLKALSSF